MRNAVIACGVFLVSEGPLLFDFESGTETWENEVSAGSTPDRAFVSRDRARSGRGALAFTHRFTKATKMLHCRVIEDPPRDVTVVPGFLGFSAWVYIPNGRDYWEAKMFVRSGERWDWGEGPTVKNCEPGWHRVEVPLANIAHPGLVQDLGIEVINFTEEIESTILIDQVEMILSAEKPAAAGAR